MVYGEWLRKMGEVGESAMHVSPDKLSVFNRRIHSLLLGIHLEIRS